MSSRWTNYRLRATYGKWSKTIVFEDVSDTEATFKALFIVLDKAKKDNLWALGHIELINANTNTLIQQMPAK